MHKIIVSQLVLLSLFVGQPTFAAKYESASSRLREVNALDNFETSQQDIKELYFTCSEANDERSCQELSTRHLCKWEHTRRVLKNITTFWGVKEFIAYEAESHCGVNLCLLLTEHGLGMRVFAAIAASLSAAFFWATILDGNDHVALYFSAITSSITAAHSLFRDLDSLYLYNFLSTVHKNTTISLQ